MALSFYQAAVPTCMRALKNLSALLDKGAAYAEARGIEPSVLLNLRLFPDMFPLAMQVVIAGDIARGGAARLAGLEVPSFESPRSTFVELGDTLKRSIEFLATLEPERFQGAEDRTITWTTRSATREMQGTPYLFNHVLPNVFFHVTTAYDILRHAGVEIGKQDFLGRA